jgi:hypothetical protein
MKNVFSILAVTAIVTSAFAFTKKNTLYCVRSFLGNACLIIQNKMESPTGTAYSHFPLAAGKWDGTVEGCLNASPTNHCIEIIKLIND